jgi:hypothetical protein
MDTFRLFHDQAVAAFRAHEDFLPGYRAWRGWIAAAQAPGALTVGAPQMVEQAFDAPPR